MISPRTNPETVVDGVWAGMESPLRKSRMTAIPGSQPRTRPFTIDLPFMTQSLFRTIITLSHDLTLVEVFPAFITVCKLNYFGKRTSRSPEVPSLGHCDMCRKLHGLTSAVELSHCIDNIACSGSRNVIACNVYKLQRLGGLKRIGTSEFRIVSPGFSIFSPLR